MTINDISGQIVDAAIKVHSALGPGLLESAYECCMLFELHKRGVNVIAQVELPVVYENVRIDAGYRLDLLFEDAVIVELKAVETILPIHKAQIISYLKLSGKQLGLSTKRQAPQTPQGRHQPIREQTLVNLLFLCVPSLGLSSGRRPPLLR